MRISSKIFNILFFLTFLIFTFSCERNSNKESEICVADNECSQEKICRKGACIIPLCEKDSNCKDENICDNGVCVTPFCKKDNDCNTPLTCQNGRCRGSRFTCFDKVCSENEICASDNRCYSEKENIPCNDSFDCPFGICEKNLCIEKICSNSSECPLYSFCSKNECKFIECAFSCKNDYICSEFQCYYRESCLHYSECPETNLCYKGTCDTVCSHNEDCPYPSICENGLCKILTCISTEDCTNSKCINHICISN